ncbi:MAG: DUF4105 domain-containing protein [Polaribacter sp.]|nr:DUF4105 domain-containing protein [Polaribacter sp.]
MTIQKHVLIIALLFAFQMGFGQYKQLSSAAEISIITAGPGKVLYEGFGHSTIRVQDKNLELDLAYNYGIFDFNAPNFYLNFVKGNLFYKLEKYPFHYFVRSYNQQHRWVKEQILNLNQPEKQQFFDYLENNAAPENAVYSYDPFFNNCATKLRDITDNILQENVIFSTTHLTNIETLRKLMNKEISWNSWGSFGINLALGNRLDKLATEKEYMYLPDYVHIGFKNATIIHNGIEEKLIKKEQLILKYKELSVPVPTFSPFVLFSLLMFIGLWITYSDIKKQQRTKWLDFLLFFSTGLLGALIIFLWFFTNHSTAPNNYNFLWAFAPNLFIAFYSLQKHPKKWLQKYVQFLLLLFLIIPLIWIGNIQRLPMSIIPLLILLCIRYVALANRLLTVK